MELKRGWQELTGIFAGHVTALSGTSSVGHYAAACSADQGFVGSIHFGHRESG